jgi:hypothetical protein
MRRLGLVTAVAVFFLSAFVPAFGRSAPQSKKKAGPETYSAYARVTATDVSGGAYVTFRIDKYSAERDIQAMEQALKTGGSAAFIEALRKAPVVGHIELGDKKFAIRWARQQPTAAGSVISLVTDVPVYFVGAAGADAKPRAGFDVAVVQLVMAAGGIGEGTMAAAARVKAGGPTGVEIEDYAAAPLKLASVTKVLS